MQVIQRNAGKFFLIGLGIVAAYNWRLWQRDKALAERLRAERTPLPKLSRTPKVSALVAAWNEADHIDVHIQSFLALGYPDIELILCAGGADDTLARARTYESERVIVLEQRPGEGKQKALARCFEQASGEIIYLTDADCWFDEEALVRLLAPIVNEGEQAATGSSRPLDQQIQHFLPLYIWAMDTVASSQWEKNTSGLLGRNAAISRASIERTGGLDFVAQTGTDYLLARRLTAKQIPIYYERTSIVPSIYPERIDIYRRKRSRWLRNLLMYGVRYGEVRDVMASASTISIGTIMLLLPVLSLFTGILCFAGWLILLVHSICSRARYILFTLSLYQQKLRFPIIFQLFWFSLVDFFVWFSAAVDLITSKGRHKW